MKRFLTLILFIIFPVVALAVSDEIIIPDEGWRISFDSPPLSKKQEFRKGSEYMFRATSGRFNISIFVEKPRGEGKTHKDCYDFYWPSVNCQYIVDKKSCQYIVDNGIF
jgi:hypothetical protein